MGFNGLFGLVQDVLREDALSGHLFLSSNRQRTRLKEMVFDGSGLWVRAKRLEKGRFAWPEAREDNKPVVLRAEQLTMLLNGIDLRRAAPRRWYRRERKSSSPEESPRRR
jgi:transposase